MDAFHLGVNLGHERSAAIVRDGRLEVAIEQERIDRRKFSVGLALQAPDDMSLVSLPWQAIRYCLDACGISLGDVATITANMPGIDRAGEVLARTLPPEVADRAQVIPSHHLAHAFSAFWPSGFDAAGILVVDASGTTFPDGTTESYSLYDAAGENIRLIHSERVPAHLAGLSTLGFLYEYVTRKAGFVTRLGEHLQHPEAGKLMGLAPYGRQQPRLRRWVLAEEDSYHLRIPAYDIFLEIAALEKRYDDGVGKPYLRPWVVDLALHAQRELEDALIHLGRRLLAETGRTRLCLAGGVALNSVANYALLTRSGLEDIFVFPAAGDSGVAAGCAWWAYRTLDRTLESGRERHRLLHAGLGRQYSREVVYAAIAEFDDRLCVEELAADEMVARTAQMLARGQIVARFEGGSEYGPRALGHRSILADPAFGRMKDILNARVKFRETFRPFAPAVPLEKAAEVFECPVNAPFMLLVAPVREQHRPGLPAITHVDGTGRVQTLTAAENQFLHSVCHALRRSRPGPPVVLNTSFNVAGQPIVETPREAIETFLATDIDALALEGFWIRKRGVPVLDYADHLARVEDGPLPHGLDGDVPDLTPTMADLDSALFAGTPSPFTPRELQRLAADGARFKETSLLFPGLGPLAGVDTRLSDSTVVVLDGLAGARLCDLADRQPPQALTQDEAILLLAAHARDDGAVQSQRCRMRLTTQQLRERIGWLGAQARRFGVDLPPADEPNTGHLLNASGPEEEIFPRLDGADPHTRRLLGQLRQVLHQAGYTGTEITRLLGVPQQQLLPTHLHYWAKYRLDASPLADLIRLFHLRQALDPDRLTDLLGADLVDLLQRQNLLIHRGNAIASRVDLFELEGLYIATDHRFCLLEEDRIGEEPVMYVGTDSVGLVHVTPPAPAETTLDLCCGSGVQGLAASRWSRQVVGVDLNPRAIRFSIFNALLNGIDNIQFRRGDLYTPVTGQRFEVILANPPFVPSPDTGYQFRDGGRDGEALLRPIIEGGADHLTPAGRLALVTDLVDLPNYETKLRRWWSGGGTVLVLSTADRDEALFAVPHCHAPFGQSYHDYNDQLQRWVDSYRDAGLTAVNFGYILLERSATGDNLHFTARTIHSPTRPIHQDIHCHFRQQHLVRTSDLHDLWIRVHPAIRIHEQTTPDGSQQHLELTADGNESFSTYAISTQVRDLLRALSPHGQPWATLAALAPEPLLHDLLAKGILVLDGPGGGPDAGEIRPGELPPAGRTPHLPGTSADQWTLHERPTKTTPTCLTSYLS